MGRIGQKSNEKTLMLKNLFFKSTLLHGNTVFKFLTVRCLIFNPIKLKCVERSLTHTPCRTVLQNRDCFTFEKNNSMAHLKANFLYTVGQISVAYLVDFMVGQPTMKSNI